MSLPPHKDPNVSKWLKEQNAVATKYGYINSKTGEQLTSDTTLPKPHKDLLPNVKPKGEAQELPEEEGQDEEVTAVTYTFVKSEESVEATLTNENNDTGHQFSLGTLNVSSGSFPRGTKLAITDNSLSTYKIKLVNKTIDESGEVQAILQRARKDQNDEVTHEVTITLKVGDKQQQFSNQYSIQISQNIDALE